MAEAPVTVPRMKLGSQGLEVSALGLGCMGMSAYYGPPKPEPDMIALIHHAVAAGVTLLDTSDVYGPHTNEILLGKALQGGVREKVQLATKFGIRLGADGGTREIRGDPAYVRAACEGSLKRLGVDCIDLYYQGTHRGHGEDIHFHAQQIKFHTDTKVQGGVFGTYLLHYRIDPLVILLYYLWDQNG